MGSLYFGPYHVEINAHLHEGYTVRVMPDGSETSGWGGGYEDTGHVGYRARCECGWSGATVYPVPDPDPMECEQARLEWMREHITPRVEWAKQTVWPGWHRITTERASQVWGHVTAGRHREAVEVLTVMGADLDVRIRVVDELAQAGAELGG